MEAHRKEVDARRAAEADERDAKARAASERVEALSSWQRRPLRPWTAEENTRHGKLTTAVIAAAEQLRTALTASGLGSSGYDVDDDDRDLIALRRTDAHRLGMALQICTVRYIGRFLGEDPLAVSWEAVEYLAGQLGIADASCVKRYPERRSTVYEHAAEIQKRFKYRDFTDRKWGREFRGFGG